MAQSKTTEKLTITSVEDTLNPATGFLDVALGAADDVTYAEVDNSGETNNISYTKFFNSKAPTIGTTDPVMILPAGWTNKAQFVFSGGLGAVFTTALSVATVDSAGTAGTTPVDPLTPVRLVF